MSKHKERVDVLLVERGLCESRARAQALLMSGKVFSGEVRIDKTGTNLRREAPLTVREDDNPFVSRGGLKLRGALQTFAPLGLDPKGLVALDVGASTGGFTDCLLSLGAVQVFAVDVGYGQLHQRLRNDPRVVVRERENARYLTSALFPVPIDLVVVDASFIRMGLLMPAIAAVLRPGASLCAMIKPQFEAGKEVVDRGRGVVSDEGERRTAIASAVSDIVAAGFVVVGETASNVPGPKGNREHFVFARRTDAAGPSVPSAPLRGEASDGSPPSPTPADLGLDSDLDDA
jgi:23S rRNA (cytidine1920-2'-O)/16S rRNA (cytidine1409-2'-O)-methyltransferase